MEKQGLVVSRVEDFIKRIHDGDLVLTYEAKTIMLSRTNEKGGWEKEQHSLAVLLGNAMSAYQKLKDSSESSVTTDDPIIKITINSRLKNVARELLDCIELGYTYGVIKDQKITDKIRECQEQNQQLKEKVDKLEKENQKLHATLKNFGKAGFVTDVTDESEDKP